MKKRVPATIILSFIIVACCSVSALAQAEAPRCAGIRTLARCPDTGCGGRGADPLLNQMRNRTQDARNPETLTLGDIRPLREPRPWPDGQERSSIARNEERAVIVTGFLARASQSRIESTNCGLRGPANNDNHLDLVSTSNGLLGSAVTAEITPRVRRNQRGWDFAKLRFLAQNRMFVRVTGWLMLDTQHISNPLTRSTNWEIHPVTEFEVCTVGVRTCQRGDGWVRLEEWRVPRRRTR